MTKITLLSLRAGLWTATALSALAAPASAGVTLRVLMEDVPETTIVEAMLPEFTAKTGIAIEFEKIGYGDMHDKLVLQLVAPVSYYNLLEVDFLWAGEFPKAGWLTDLAPYAAKSGTDLNDFIPAVFDLLGRTPEAMPIIPMHNYSMGLIYRTDLLADPQLAAAFKADHGADLAFPATLEDYVQLSKFMKAKAGVAGAAMQGQRGDPNSMEFSNYLFAVGGRYMDGGKVALDSPEARTALSLYVDNIRNGAQQGALSANLDDTLRLMCAGEAFSMVTYWWMLSQLDNAAKCPAVAGKLALSVMPGGHGESGAWGWSIPTNVSDEEKAAAWTFIDWAQSRDVVKARALQGHAPAQVSAFNDAAVLAKYPHYADAAKIVASGMSFPIFTYTAEYENVLGTQLSDAGSGGTTVDAAVTAAAKGLADLLAR
ncbi:MAG: extracellular solute-binding protein [Roseovarius sp.]|nr:extracellular solute-binding protein [Roseovarius sp.]